MFFFQAEDGIRFWSVTGVQTCALPIFRAGIEWAFRLVREPRRMYPRFRDSLAFARATRRYHAEVKARVEPH